jgi:long-chain-fatty-acid--CoA ligase ACSBG
VPPNHVEQLVKSELPAISNAFLVGDRKKFLTMLITIKTQMAPDSGMPLDDLAEEAIQWMQDLGLNYRKLSDILNNGPDPTVLQGKSIFINFLKFLTKYFSIFIAIQKGIERANKKAISQAQKVQKFRILAQDFSMTTGEYGPTMKVKRNVVVDKYKDVIEKMYD